MGQTNISIRIDEDVKKDAEILFTKLGLTLSAATNVFYRQAIRAQGIPFSVTAIGAHKQLSEDILARGRIALIKHKNKPLLTVLQK
jgi:addiction module RelB/DinJ family antitoxin